jgi:hypothetical protein
MLDRCEFVLVVWKTVSYYLEYQSFTVGFERQDVESTTIFINNR